VSELYGYVHVARRVDPPPALGEPRTPGRHLQGYVAGMGQSIDFDVFGTDEISQPYILQGAGGAPTSVGITNHPTNTVSATFVMTEPLAESPVDTAVFNFGGAGTANGSFIDDRVFAAQQSRHVPSVVNGATGSTASVFAPYGLRGAFVSSQTLIEPGEPLLDQATCTCAYLSWGLWTAEFRNTDDTRREHMHIGSWVAGDLPEVGDLPTSGVAAYTGHAIGVVFNGGRQYLATGKFTNTWNFATEQGTIRIDGFDGRDFTGTANAKSGADYGGPISGPDGISGRVDGSFFRGGGDPVAETGGQFRLDGEGYRASGTFAGTK
jgi:hypothetical protein